MHVRTSCWKDESEATRGSRPKFLPCRAFGGSFLRPHIRGALLRIAGRPYQPFAAPRDAYLERPVAALPRPNRAVTTAAPAVPGLRRAQGRLL